MPPQSTLLVQFVSTATSTIPEQTSPTQAPDIFTGPSSDLEARSTIVFGVFGTFLATVGLVLTGMTLRVMYRNHKARHNAESDRHMGEIVEMEMQDIERQDTEARHNERNAEGGDIETVTAMEYAPRTP